MTTVTPEPDRSLALLDAVQTPLLLINADGTHALWANHITCALTGYPPAYWAGLPLEQCFGESAVGIRPDRAWTARLCIAGDDKAYIPVQVRPEVTEYLGGPAVLLTLLRMDLPRRADAESEGLRAILDRIPAVLWATDADDTFIASAGRGLQALGLEPGQVVGLNVRDVYHNQPEVLRLFEPAARQRARHQRLDHWGRHYEAWMFPHWVEGKYAGMAGISIDLNALPDLVDTLDQTQDIYRKLLDDIVEAVYIVSSASDFPIQSVNTAAQASLGIAPGEIAGMGLLTFIHPHDLDEVREVLSTLGSADQLVILTYRRRKASGEYITVEASAKRIADNTIQVIERDISERTRMQQAQLEREVLRLQYQKERELNMLRISLMHTISHELRTPLAVILTSTELLERYFDRLTADKRENYLRRIKAQVEYLKEMLQDISFVVSGNAYGGITHDEEEHEAVDIREMCLEIISKVGRTIGVENSFELIADDREYALNANAHYVSRVIFNLLSSAVKYSDPKTTIYVHLRQDGDAYQLQVIDGGKGRDPEETRQLLAYGQQMIGGEYAGSFGLGLTIVRQYVNLLNGRLSVESTQPDQADTLGSVFSVYLPIIPDAP